MNVLEEFACDHWEATIGEPDQRRALEALESGHVLYFPRLRFVFEEAEGRLLDKSWETRSRKNVSYEPRLGSLGGVPADEEAAALLAAMMRRYADSTQGLLHRLLPQYRAALARARTSFRPVEIAGRRAPSYRKDDTLLHVDAFPSRPTGGARILRVFSNVDPRAGHRAWRLGEPFAEYARRFLSRARPPLPGSAALLELLGVTKQRRTPYDHFMLQLHDRGKADREYQRGAPQTAFGFPSGSTWMAFTDQVLHAADAGRYLLEQTFHLPVAAQAHPERSPLRVLERLAGQPLA